MKTDLFQSCGQCWVFQICWHIEYSTLTASSFKIWNSSTGIPSPPLALFVVVLPMAHLTLHCRISGSWGVIIPLWLSWSWRSFLYSSSVYSCHLFLISSYPLETYFNNCIILYKKSFECFHHLFVFLFIGMLPFFMIYNTSGILFQWFGFKAYFSIYSYSMIAVDFILSFTNFYLSILLTYSSYGRKFSSERL